MKRLLTVFFIALSFNSFGASVVDSMYESNVPQNTINRDLASQPSQFCLVNEEQKVFAKSCYSSMETCEKRRDFWKDLPGAKNHACAKI